MMDNNNHWDNDTVYVVGYKFSGLDLVQATVDNLLAVRHSHTPPACRNPHGALTSTCVTNQLPTSHFQQYMTLAGIKVVLVLRNPKDIAVAIHKTSGLEAVIPFSDALDRFVDSETEEGSWYEHTSQWLKMLSMAKPPQVHIVYYDSFMQDLEEEIDSLCSFLGVQISHDSGLALCTQISRESQQPQRKRQRTHANSDGHKDNFHEVGLWKNYFSVTHDETFNTRFSHKLVGLQLLDLNKLFS